MVDVEGDQNEGERGAEEGVELKMEDEDGERGGDKHRAPDEEETRDVAAVLHDGRHDESDGRLAQNTRTTLFKRLTRVTFYYRSV